MMLREKILNIIHRTNTHTTIPATFRLSCTTSLAIDHDHEHEPEAVVPMQPPQILQTIRHKFINSITN